MMTGILLQIELLILALIGAAAWMMLRRQASGVHRAAEEAHGEVDLSLDAMTQAADLYWQTDQGGLIMGAGGRLMGKLVPDLSDIIGQHYLKTVALQPQEMTKMLAALTNGEPYSDIHSRFTAQDGQIHILSLSGTPRHDEDGNVIGYFGLGTDVTRRVAAQDELKFLAEHDPLTGLANRRAFEAKMNGLLMSDEFVSFAIIAIDLDGFKTVNDTHGHDVGDLLLQAVADRIRQCTRSTDWAARLGGDEFVFVAEDIRTVDAVSTVAERLIDALSTPYRINGQSLGVGASAGVSLAGDPRPKAEELMKQADRALYDAKAAGKGCFRFHSEASGSSSRLRLVKRA
ncbi:MAG: diguanylate cyclase [Pseudomonadota bacterium]